jgi:hypothetical protein
MKWIDFLGGNIRYEACLHIAINVATLPPYLSIITKSSASRKSLETPNEK